MIPRLDCRLLVRPQDVPSSHHEFEVIGAFNPGATELDGRVVLLVRVAERPRERRAGWTALPRWTPAGTLAVDWVRDDELELVDPRVVRQRTDGRVRLTFASHLRVVYLGDGWTIDSLGGAFVPRDQWEEFGVEDPRVTWLDDRYWITYVAVSRFGVTTALASTHDFVSFDRYGIIFCPENKDVVLFPERIGGRCVALHRPQCRTPFAPPEIWLARSSDLLCWGEHTRLAGGEAAWETGRIGAGPPPFRCQDGWLAIYHGNRRPTQPGEVGAYFAGALLLDAADPSRVVARSHEPLMEPVEPWERNGFVPDVIFPTGLVARGDSLLLYYGAGDAFTAVAKVSVKDILKTL